MNVEDINALLGDSAQAFDPFAGLRDLLPTLAIWAIGILVVAVLFLAFMTISRVRSQRATVAMQKDIRIIREMMERQYVNSPTPPEVLNDPQLPPRP